MPTPLESLINIIAIRIGIFIGEIQADENITLVLPYSRRLLAPLLTGRQCPSLSAGFVQGKITGCRQEVLIILMPGH